MSPCLPKVSQDGQEGRAQCPSQDAWPVPSKCPVGVDDPEGIEGGVHDLSGA